MTEHSILSISYQFHRTGTLLSCYRVEYMEVHTWPVDLTTIQHKDTFGHRWTWMGGDEDGVGACLEEVDPMTEEAQQRLRYDRPSRPGESVYFQQVLNGILDAEVHEDEKVYRLTQDVFEILSYNIIGNSSDPNVSGGLEWEEDAIGFTELITDCNYPNTFHTSTLSEVIHLATEQVKLCNEVCLARGTEPAHKDGGQLLLLYSWDGMLDNYTGEFDSWWEYIGPITDADLYTLACSIAERERETTKDNDNKEDIP